MDQFYDVCNFLNGLPYGICVHRINSFSDSSHKELVFEWANERFSVLTGISQSELKDSDFLRLLNSSIKQENISFYSCFVNKGEFTDPGTVFFTHINKWLRVEFTFPANNLLATFFFDDITKQNRNIQEDKSKYQTKIFYGNSQNKSGFEPGYCEQQFRTLTHASSDAFVMYENSTIIECNDELCNMFGYSKAELIDINILQLIAPDYRAIVDQKMLTGSNLPDTVNGLRKNGTIFTMEIRGLNAMCPGKSYRIIEFRDISQIKQAEKENRETIELLQRLNSLEPLENLILSVEELFVKWGLADKVKIFVYNYFGNRSDDFISDNSIQYSLDSGHEKIGCIEFFWFDNHKITKTLSDHLHRLSMHLAVGLKQNLSNKMLAESENRFRSYINLSPFGIFVLDRNGTFMEINPAMKDLTGFTDADFFSDTDKEVEDIGEFRNQINQFIKKGKDYFEVILKTKNSRQKWFGVFGVEMENGGYLGMMKDISDDKQMTKELLKSKVKAEQANKAKSEFLANISHELRTPLNGVIGFSELLMTTSLSEMQSHYMHNVNVSARSLMDVISTVLDFSKIEAGKLELFCDKTDLQELCETVAEIVQYNAHHKGLELIVNIPPDLPSVVMADEMRLRQVLVNLIGNAVKFTDSGEVEILLRKFPLEENNMMDFYFSVRDTGIGISDGDRKKLFRAFSQVDGSSTRKYGGTGLGLVISNMLLKKMGSRIDLVSEPGKGSTFSFSIRLPVIEQSRVKIIPDQIKKALVLTGNLLNCQVICNLLEYHSIDCQKVQDGLNALQFLEADDAFDLVIIEYNLPTLNGFDIVRNMQRQLGKTGKKQSVVMIFSSMDDSRLFEESGKFNVMFNLVKPVKISEFSNMLIKVNDSLKPDKEILLSESHCSNCMIINSADYIIMVVEDNIVNMLLTVEILNQILPNSRILRALDGKAAIEQYEQLKPNLIFMDLNMPEMNGLKATSEIRIREKKAKIKEVPIIALTANVLEGTIQECLEAGMNGYLSKPLSKERVYRTLLKFLEPVSQIPDVKASTKQLSFYNEHFNKSALMEKISWKESVYLRLVESVKLELPSCFLRIGDAISTGDLTQIGELAHAIKGVSSSMHFQRLTSIAKEMEHHLNLSQIEGLLKNMEEEYKIIVLLF